MENTGSELPAKAPAASNEKMHIAHVGLRTTDYKGTLQWYTEKLDFRVLQEWTVGELQLAFLAPPAADTCWLEVVSGALTSTPLNPFQPGSSGFQHFCLAVDNVDATLASLRAKEVQVIREPFNVPAIGKRCGFITDLHGNVIEFASNLE